MSELLYESHSTLCRICLDEGNYNIKENFLQLADEDISGMDMLEHFSNLDCSSIKNIPSLICDQCLSELIHCFLFLTKVKNADENINLALLTPSKDDQDVSNQEDDEINVDTDTLNCQQHENDNSEPFVEIIVMNENNYECHVNNIADDIEEDSLITTGTTEYMEDLTNQSPENNEVYLKQEIVKTSKCRQSNNENDVAKKRKIVNKKLLNGFDECTNEDVNVEGNSFVVGKFKPLILNETSDTIDIDQHLTTTNIRMFDFSPVVLNNTDSFDLNGEDESDIPIDEQNVIYRCQYCPKAFSSSHFLISHLSKGHVCTLCSETFVKTNDLFEHVREIHKVYKCAICKRAFKCNSNLRQHIKHGHNLTLPPHVSLLAFNRHGDDHWLSETNGIH